MFSERTVVQVNGVNVDIDVIVKDAEIEMNNNNDVAIKLTEKLIQSEDSMVKTMSESVIQTDEMAENEPKLAEIETVSESSSVNTDNGDDASEQKESMTEGDSKVEHETPSESSDEKSETTEPSEPSEPSSYTTGSETKDETPLESESSGNSSETSIENTTENTVETSEQPKVVEPSEQSGDNEHQKEKKEEEEKGTVTTAESKNDAQPEQKGDDANKSVKSESSKRSPRKKGSNKKRKNRSRSQKKEDDYSDLDKYTVSVSHRQRRYSLHVTRGRVIEAPGDDCEIFCSNIPINVLEGELIPLFERYGKIWELRLMMSLRNPKRNAGFAFVRYTSNASAQEATEKLNNYEILPGKHLAIRLSQPNLSLFVGNIHRGLTREQIHEKISSRTTGKHSFS